MKKIGEDELSFSLISNWMNLTAENKAGESKIIT